MTCRPLAGTAPRRADPEADERKVAACWRRRRTWPSTRSSWPGSGTVSRRCAPSWTIPGRPGADAHAAGVASRDPHQGVLRDAVDHRVGSWPLALHPTPAVCGTPTDLPSRPSGPSRRTAVLRRRRRVVRRRRRRRMGGGHPLRRDRRGRACGDCVGGRRASSPGRTRSPNSTRRPPNSAHCAARSGCGCRDASRRSPGDTPVGSLARRHTPVGLLARRHTPSLRSPR